MDLELKKILVEISQLSTFVPVSVGLYYHKRLDKMFKVLLGYVLLSLFMEYFATWYGRVFTNNNMPPLHFYTIVELGCLSYIFCDNLFGQNKSKMFMWIMAVGIMLGILNVTIIGSIYKLNYVSRSYEFIVLVILSLLYFKKSLTIVPGANHILTQPMFWFSNATLIYFSINLLFVLFFNKLFEGYPEMVRIGLILHAIANIIANLLYALSFRCFRKVA